MEVDWFTVGAQILNFLILVWLLRRFLYRPVLNAIDAREARIAQKISEADAVNAEAGVAKETFRLKNEEFDQERAAMMAVVTEETAAERQRLLEAARHDADALSAKRRAALEIEARTLNKTLTARAAAEVFAIARSTLKDLAGADLETRMIGAFADRLSEIDDDGKAMIATAIKTAAEPAIIRTTYELEQVQRDAIQTLLNTTFSTDIRTQFETSPDLISGIEVLVGGQKIAWSIDEYLQSLEAGVSTVLGAQEQPDTAQAPTTNQSLPAVRLEAGAN